MQQVKGTVIKSRLSWVEEQFGKEAVQKVIARLGPDDQRALKIVFTSNWYPMGLCLALDAAIVSELGGGRTEIFEKLGEASADRNLHGVHAGYLVPGDPHGFLSKAPQIYAAYYETGRREYERTGDQSATLTTYNAENVTANDCLTVIGWHRKALEYCGATNVRISHPECVASGGSKCRYDIRWG